MKTIFVLVIFFLWSISASAQTTIQLADVGEYVGDSVTVCGKVSGGLFLEQAKGKPTFLNLGAAFPNHSLTIVIWNDVRKLFEKAPEELFKDKDVCVTGRVELFRGKPQIVVRRKRDMRELIK